VQRFERLYPVCEALGRGIAEEFLRRIAALAAARGTASFRIDTNFDNTPMLRVLRRAGFAHCGTIDYDGAERLAFEKALE
jgi:RimJ/RimL family protein N-acetyltransferase